MHNHERVKKALSPHHDIIYGCVEKGVHKTFEITSEHGLLTKRSQANICYELTTNFLKRELSEEHFIVRDQYASSLFILKDEDIVFRFKKFDENGNSKNIATQRNFDFISGQLTFPNMRDPITLDIGYSLSHFGDTVSSVSVQCRSESWCYEINPIVNPNVIEQDFSQQTAPVQKRVFAKNNKKDILKAENDNK